MQVCPSVSEIGGEDMDTGADMESGEAKVRVHS